MIDYSYWIIKIVKIKLILKEFYNSNNFIRKFFIIIDFLFYKYFLKLEKIKGKLI
jgi:hypothetical protein